jgi:hypothetical protein
MLPGTVGVLATVVALELAGLELETFKTCPSWRSSLERLLRLRSFAMVVPLSCAILLKLSPALTVTVVFEVLLEVEVVLSLALVVFWLEPETLST